MLPELSTEFTRVSEVHAPPTLQACTPVTAELVDTLVRFTIIVGPAYPVKLQVVVVPLCAHDGVKTFTPVGPAGGGLGVTTVTLLLNDA